MLVATAVLTLMLVLVDAEDEALSGTTTGTQLSGGRDVSAEGGPMCRDAPMELEVDGFTYAGPDLAFGGCLADGETKTVELRYDPDRPGTFSSSGRDWAMPVLIAGSASGFLLCLGTLLYRLWVRVTGRRPSVSPDGR